MFKTLTHSRNTPVKTSTNKVSFSSYFNDIVKDAWTNPNAQTNTRLCEALSNPSDVIDLDTYKKEVHPLITETIAAKIMQQASLGNDISVTILSASNDKEVDTLEVDKFQIDGNGIVTVTEALQPLTGHEAANYIRSTNSVHVGLLNRRSYLAMGLDETAGLVRIAPIQVNPTLDPMEFLMQEKLISG